MLLVNEGRRVRVRQARGEDATTLMRAYRDESFIRLFRSNTPEMTEEKLSREMSARAEVHPGELGCLELIIEHVKTAEPLGVATLADYSAVHKRAEYLVGLFSEHHRHLGLGPEATLLVLDLCFNYYGMNKIFSYAYEYNIYSLGAMLKLGFIEEGRLRKHHFLEKENRFVDMFMTAVVVDDFRQNAIMSRLSQRLLGRDVTIEPLRVAVESADVVELDNTAREKILAAFVQANLRMSATQ